MGTRLNGITPGAACACHPVPVTTPETLYVLLDGVGKCPLDIQVPGGVTWVCHQDSVQPCKWESTPDSDGFIMRVEFLCGSDDVQITLLIPIVGNFFFGLLNLPISEYARFDNNFGGCAVGQHAFGGTAVLFWLAGVLDLVFAFDLPTDGDGLFLESFFVSDTEIVHRFANRTYSLNQMYKINS